MDIQQLLLTALIGILTTLLMGRFLRTLILLPFQKWAARSPSKDDDRLVEAAEKDLGVEHYTEEPSNGNTTTEK
jgi:hypothetical protein